MQSVINPDPVQLNSMAVQQTEKKKKKKMMIRKEFESCHESFEDKF